MGSKVPKWLLRVKIPGVPWDKGIHFIGGALVALVMLGIRAGTEILPWGFWSVGIVFCTVVALAVLKEYLDSKDPEHHTVDVWDAVATVLGGVAVIVLFALL